MFYIIGQINLLLLPFYFVQNHFCELDLKQTDRPFNLFAPVQCMDLFEQNLRTSCSITNIPASDWGSFEQHLWGWASSVQLPASSFPMDCSNTAVAGSPWASSEGLTWSHGKSPTCCWWAGDLTFLKKGEEGEISHFQDLRNALDRMDRFKRIIQLWRAKSVE